MKSLFTTMLVLAMTATAAFGQLKQTITINGTAVEKTAVQLTFEGDNVVLHYSDNTTVTVDMESVRIAFSGTSVGINNVEAFTFNGVVGGTLSIGNIAAGTPVTVYSASGAQMLATKASGTSVQLNIESLKNGVYVLKAGNNVVKFVKR